MFLLINSGRSRCGASFPAHATRDAIALLAEHGIFSRSANVSVAL